MKSILEPTAEEEIISVMSRYPKIFPLPRMDRQIVTSIRDRFREVDFSQPVLVLSPGDYMKSVFGRGIFHFPFSFDFALYSATELADIWLSKGDMSPESLTPRSLAEVTSHVLGVYLGYSEVPNKSLHAVVEQILANSLVRGPVRDISKGEVPIIRGQSLWLYYRGTEGSMRQVYGTVYSAFEEAKKRGYADIIDLHIPSGRRRSVSRTSGTGEGLDAEF